MTANHTTTTLIEHQKVQTIIENVDQARQDMLEGFKLLEGAKQRLGAVLGAKDYNGYSNLWRERIWDHGLLKTAEECDRYISCNAWRYVLAQTGMLQYMTERRRDELHAQLDKGTFPTLTVENVFTSLEGLTQQLGPLLIESVKEVFEWLRPHRSQYKTNKRWQVGTKVILSALVTPPHYAGGGWNMSAYRDANIRSLGNVFSLLDGEGIPQYPNDLITHLRTALQTARSGERFTLPYMSMCVYGNGNAHVTFSRPDLVTRLNQLASDGSLGDHE